MELVLNSPIPQSEQLSINPSYLPVGVLLWTQLNICVRLVKYPAIFNTSSWLRGYVVRLLLHMDERTLFCQLGERADQQILV